MAVQPEYHAPGPPSRAWVEPPLQTASTAPDPQPGQAMLFKRAKLLRPGDVVYTRPRVFFGMQIPVKVWEVICVTYDSEGHVTLDLKNYEAQETCSALLRENDFIRVGLGPERV